jgi:hypothetical protein
MLGNAWLDLLEVKRPSDEGEPTVHFGTILTGDKVDAIGHTGQYMAQWPKAIGVEMEAGGVAAVAFQAADQPGFLMVRGVSDLADRDKDSRLVRGWRSYACDVAASWAVAFLRSAPVPPAPRDLSYKVRGTVSDEEIQHQRELLATARRRLQFLEIRAAKSGWDASPSLTMELDELRKEVEKLSAALRKMEEDGAREG